MKDKINISELFQAENEKPEKIVISQDNHIKFFFKKKIVEGIVDNWQQISTNISQSTAKIQLV